jgi:hypothetical protein
MAKRGLTYQQAQARRREIARLEMKEIRRHRPSPKGTKYFVARTNGSMLLLLAVGVPVLVICLSALKLMDLPILAACMGAVIAISAVQPWLRQTVSFWLSIVISCTVQLFVGHWISVHQAPHSRGAKRGILGSRPDSSTPSEPLFAAVVPVSQRLKLGRARAGSIAVMGSSLPIAALFMDVRVYLNRLG